ncbi:MAG: OmpA family protein [Bacteroidaceae bacterium]|nr:OmpA family protein [Bacteroidaceae bacterium]
MTFFKRTLLAAAAIACALTASAQDAYESEAWELGYKPYPYNFIQLQGGIGETFTNAKFTDIMTPTASIGFGRFFAPAIGARLHVNGWESKGGFRSITDTYKYKYITGNVDILLNLNNLFSKKSHHFLNVILVGGVGLSYAWQNNDMAAIVAKGPRENTMNAWGKGFDRDDLLSHNLRAGVLLDFNIAKHWALGVEVDFNSLDDRFNSKYTNRDDWMMTGQISLTYKFGMAKSKKPDVDDTPYVGGAHDFGETDNVDQGTVNQPNTTIIKEAKPLKEVVYYAINVSDPKNVEAVAAECARWCKENPTKKLHVTGYADKGTGTAVINQRISDARAKKMVEALKNAGVLDSQIVSEGLGDKVQPFTSNDDNRCVIIEGK